MGLTTGKVIHSLSEIINIFCKVQVFLQLFIFFMCLVLCYYTVLYVTLGKVFSTATNDLVCF